MHLSREVRPWLTVQITSSKSLQRTTTLRQQRSLTKYRYAELTQSHTKMPHWITVIADAFRKQASQQVLHQNTEGLNQLLCLFPPRIVKVRLDRQTLPSATVYLYEES
jgi:hypothetical protein